MLKPSISIVELGFWGNRKKKKHAQILTLVKTKERDNYENGNQILTSHRHQLSYDLCDN